MKSFDIIFRIFSLWLILLMSCLHSLLVEGNEIKRQLKAIKTNFLSRQFYAISLIVVDSREDEVEIKVEMTHKTRFTSFET